MAGPLTPDETAELLAADFGLRDPDLAELVHETTGGHAGLVRRYGQVLVAQGLAHGPLPPALASEVTAELLSELPMRARRMLAELSGIAPLSDELCAVLGYGPLRDIEDLVRDGAVIPVVARSVRLGKPPAVDTLLRAARWYEDHGLIASAVRAYASAGDEPHWLRLLDAHGQSLRSAGHAALIVELLGALPPAYRTRDRQLLLGDALRTTGAVSSAGNAYSLVADAEREWDAALALRMGSVHYLRGDARGAVKAYDRARIESSSTSDRALLLAWRSGAHRQLNDIETATRLAEEAMHLAAAADDDMVLATAYVSLAMCRMVTTGDPSEPFERALRITERCGDVVLRGHILTNQTDHLLHQARYPEALKTARETHHCAKLAGNPSRRALALCHEGEALTMLGRFEAAIRQYERATVLSRGKVPRRRGWLEQARTAYDAAARLAGEAGNAQVRVVAQAGLARIVALASGPGLTVTPP